MSSKYSSIAQRYLNGIQKSGVKKYRQKHKCYECGMQFQNSLQLLNHSKKFCTNSGFDTLAGLNIKLKHPNIKQNKKQQKNKNDSLTNALEEINKNILFKPQNKQMTNDLLDYQEHKHNVQFIRPYMRKSRNDDTQFRKSRSLYMQTNQNQYQNNNKNNSKAFIQYQNLPKSKAYSFTSSYVKRFKDSDAYISPPTQLPQIQNAKRFSLLDKSDMSIKNMPQDQKREYIVRKILELQNIEEAYKKNGGKKNDFIQNTKKMKIFYQKLLTDINQHKQSRFGKMSKVTRVSTPISQLQKLTDSKVSNQFVNQDRNKQQSKLTKKLTQFHQKSMAKKQDHTRKRFKTQFPGQNQQQQFNQDIIDQQIIKKINRKSDQPIIVIPITQPAPPQPIIQQNDLQLKYLQSLMQMKQKQNRKLMEIMQKQNSQMKQIYQKQLKNKQKEFKNNQKKIQKLQQKYSKLYENQRKLKQRKVEKLIQQNYLLNNKSLLNDKSRHKTLQNYYDQQKQQEQQYRQRYKDLVNVRKLNLNSDGFYSQENIQNFKIPYQDKILLQMQRQQRDQLQLYSYLPKQIQQMKLKSITQMTQKRFQMQKQILKQKIQKLNVQQGMKYFDHDRKIVNEQIQNQRKKIQIHKLMKKKINQFAKLQFQSSSESSDQDQEDQHVIPPQEQIINTNKTSMPSDLQRRSHNNPTPTINNPPPIARNTSSNRNNPVSK